MYNAEMKEIDKVKKSNQLVTHSQPTLAGELDRI